MSNIGSQTKGTPMNYAMVAKKAQEQEVKEKEKEKSKSGFTPRKPHTLTRKTPNAPKKSSPSDRNWGSDSEPDDTTCGPIRRLDHFLREGQ